MKKFVIFITLLCSLLLVSQPAIQAIQLVPPSERGGVPIPENSAYFGGTNAKDNAKYPSCSKVGQASYQYPLLECKIGKSAHQQKLTKKPSSYVSSMEHFFTSCDGSNVPFKAGGVIHQSAKKLGRKVLLINMKCGNWSVLGNGEGKSKLDDHIRQKVQLLAQLDVPVLLVFHHEPENDSCGSNGYFGTPLEYRQAYRQFVKTARDEQIKLEVNRISFGLVLMGYTYERDGQEPFVSCNGVVTNSDVLRNPENWYPGDDVVDWLMADPYDHSGKRSFSELITPFYAWSEKDCPEENKPVWAYNCSEERQQKPLLIAEYATKLTGAAKAEWLKDHQAKLSEFPKVKGYSYWSSQVSDTANRYVIDDPKTDPQRLGLAAFTKLAHDPYFSNLKFKEDQLSLQCQEQLPYILQILNWTCK